MANKLTPYINENNILNIRTQINMKKGCEPYLATKGRVTETLTDYDTFPYPRYFRGIPEYSEPVVAEREAGWRPRHANCYNLTHPIYKSEKPNHCFESACSTVVPCYPKYLNKFSDKEALDVILNKACIPQYR